MSAAVIVQVPNLRWAWCLGGLLLLKAGGSLAQWDAHEEGAGPSVTSLPASPERSGLRRSVMPCCFTASFDPSIARMQSLTGGEGPGKACPR